MLDGLHSLTKMSISRYVGFPISLRSTSMIPAFGLAWFEPTFNSSVATWLLVYINRRIGMKTND